jgi:hypothetical protein
VLGSVSNSAAAIGVGSMTASINPISSRHHINFFFSPSGLYIETVMACLEYPQGEDKITSFFLTPTHPCP